MDPVAEAVRPVDQNARVAQRCETAAIFAHGAQRSEASCSLSQRHAAAQARRHAPAQGSEERDGVGVVGRAVRKARIGARIEPHVWVGCRNGPHALVAARATVTARPPSRSATARAYAFQSTTYGQRPGRNTVSLNNSTTTTADGIIPPREARICAARRKPPRPPPPRAAARCNASRRGSAS